MKETCSCTCSYKLHTSKPLSSTIQNDEKCRPPPPTTGFLAALQRFCIPTVMGSKLSSLPDQTKTLQNLTISPKSHNFSKISQLRQNFTILPNFHNFNNISQFHPQLRPNFQEYLEYLEYLDYMEYMDYLEYLELGQFRNFCNVYQMLQSSIIEQCHWELG